MFMRYNLDPKYRHYKKDSRFISDLYTFTYDTGEDNPQNQPNLVIYFNHKSLLIFFSRSVLNINYQLRLKVIV